MKKERVITYIDGFNLYHGLIDSQLRTSRWLDLGALSKSLLRPSQQLVLTRYFTTRVRGNAAKTAHQSTFVDALSARGQIDIDFGHFLSKSMRCWHCGTTWQRNEEKKTDVNIAVRLLEDAFDDRFEVAIIVSGDSDLVPPIQSVQTRFPDKRLLVAFPPGRSSHELRKVAHAAFRIPKSKITAHRLPNPVVTPAGVALHAPAGWLPST